MGKNVFIKVRLKKISLRLGSCAKLAPRYCGPFEILSRIVEINGRDCEASVGKSEGGTGLAKKSSRLEKNSQGVPGR